MQTGQMKKAGLNLNGAVRPSVLMRKQPAWFYFFRFGVPRNALAVFLVMHCALWVAPGLPAEAEDASKTDSLNRQVTDLCHAGKYEEAVLIARQLLEISEKINGPEHPDTAQSLNNLAELYRAMGDYAKAEPLYRRALAIREKALGPEHPDTAQSVNNLAELYKEMGDYVKAEPLYRRALLIREKALGLHPDTAKSINNLAELYKEMGDYAKAEPLYRRALLISEIALGPEDPDTAASLDSLALLYYSMGDYAKVEPLLRRALAIREKALGASRHRHRPQQPGAAQEAKPRPELAVQVGHSGAILSVAFAPDGRWFVTGGDRTARVWDVSTGREIRRLELQHEVQSVGVSKNGRWLLTGEGNGVRLWQLATGKEERKFEGKLAAISSDGRWVVTDSWGETVRLWEAETGKLLRTYWDPDSINWINAVAFSPDGRQVLVANGKTARLYETDSDKELRRFEGHTKEVKAVAASPDGRWVVTCSWDKTVRLWEAASGKELRRFECEATINSVVFSPDGRWVLTGGDDHVSTGIIQIWDAATGEKVREISMQGTGSIECVAYSPDGKSFLTGGSYTGIAQLWDAASGQQVRSFGREKNSVWAVKFSPDGRYLLIDTPKGRLWDLSTGKEAECGPKGEEGFAAVAFSSDGRILLTAGAWIAQLWEVATGKELHRLEAKDKGEQPTSPPLIESVAFSPDDRYLLTGSLDTARLWDSVTGKEIRKFAGHQAAFSPDGNQVLTAGSSAGNVVARLWETATGKEVRAFAGHTSTVYAIAFSPDGRRVATSNSEIINREASLVRLWETATGKEERRLGVHGEVYALAFSPDGHWLATAGDDGTARLWETDSGKEVYCFRGHSDAVRTVTFSPDGRWIATGSDDGSSRLWNARTGLEVASLIGTHDGLILFTADNYYMASRASLSEIVFRLGARTFSFEQFDLKYNRPDIVLERLGRAERPLIEAYAQAHQKRLQRMHFTKDMLGDDFHLPTVAVVGPPPTTTKDKRLRLKVEAKDSKYALDRLQIYVNGVPIGKANGIDLRSRKVQAWQQEFDLELSAGRNLIQVSVLNQAGAESLKESFGVLCEAPAAKPELYVLVVGIAAYQDQRYLLTYADKDARDLAAFFTGKADRFGQVKVLRLLNQDATKEKILQARDWLTQARVDDEVVVFLAGHGVLDRKLDYYFATVDMDFQEAGRRGLTYEAIEGLLDGIAARKKLLLLDTCHSGEQDKGADLLASDRRPEGDVKARAVRGLEIVHPAGISQSLLQQMFAELRRGTGTVVISASGGAEYALESAAWKNGVFTYCVLQALTNGDRNQDGRVQVSELRDQVFDEVPRLTRGRQSPTVRRENLEFDFPVY